MKFVCRVLGIVIILGALGSGLQSIGGRKPPSEDASLGYVAGKALALCVMWVTGLFLIRIGQRKTKLHSDYVDRE